MADRPPEGPDDEQDSEPLLEEEDIIQILDLDDIDPERDFHPLSDSEGDGEGEEDESESMDVEEAEDNRDDSVCTFSAHTGSVFSCALHPTEPLAVSGGEDDKAFVWNTNNGDVAFECTGHKDSVTCVGFSSDGKYASTADMSGCVQVWTVSNGQCAWNFQGEDIEWQLWHSSAPVLLAGTSGGDVWMWKVPSGDCKVMHGQSVASTSAALCPNGKTLLCGYGDGSIKLWDLKESKPLFSWEGGRLHAEAVTCLAVHHDNVLALSGSSDGRVQLFNINSHKTLESWACQDKDKSISSVESLTFSESLPLAAAGSLGGIVTVWDIPTKKERCQCSTEAGIVKLVWSKADPLLYCALLNGSVQLWDIRAPQCVCILHGHRDAILDLSLHERKGYLVTSSDDHCAKVFGISTES